MGDKSCSKSMCLIKSIIAIAVVAGVSMVIGNYFWGELYKDVWGAEEFKHLWRPEEADQWKLMPYAYALQAVIFVMAYCKFACGMKCPLGTRFGGGAIFGIYVWLLTSVVGAYWSYIIHPKSVELALICVKEGFISNVLCGGLVALILTKKSCGDAEACKKK